MDEPNGPRHRSSEPESVPATGPETGAPFAAEPSATASPEVAAPVGENKRRNRLMIIGVVAGLVFLLAYGGLVAWLIFGGSADRLIRGGEVGLIRIEGPITGSGEGEGLFGGGMVVPETIISQLREAEDDPNIAAILLRVNSPGGTAAASQEIAQEVSRVTKPVVVSIADVGASGAYWIASAADRIVASPASDVGSIGVIMTIPNYSELFKKIGVEFQTLTQGKYKDIGNPARPLTPEEKAILLSQSQEVYEQFIQAIAKGRDLPPAKVRALATGLSFPATEAKRMGLVDRLGNFRDALRLAGRLGDIEGEPEIIEFGEPTVLDELTRFLGTASQLGAFLSVAGLPDPWSGITPGKMPIR